MASNNQKAREATGAESPRVETRAIDAPPSTPDVLIGPLFSAWPDLGAIVLEYLYPVDRSLFAGASPSIRDAVMKSENPSDASFPLAVAGVTPGFGLEEFTDSLEIFRYGYLTYPELLEEQKKYGPDDIGYVIVRACSTAASKGNLDVLREARRIGCPWGRSTAIEACTHGHLRLLQWARAPYRRWPVPLTRSCYTEAVAGGHCEVLEFLCKEACEYDHKAAYTAVRIGNIRCLKIMYEICIILNASWRPANICAVAVESGRIDVLKTAWALKPAMYSAFINDDPFLTFHVLPMERAAEIGRIDMMEWLLDNGCPWGSYTCQAIADVGDPAVSKWAAEAPNGCRCNSPFGTSKTTNCSVHGAPWI